MIQKIAIATFCLLVIIEAKPFGPGFGFGRPPPPPPCGLPPFLEELPQDAQTKLQAIWKDYKEGEKCYEEQGLERELLESLPKEVKKSVFKHPPPPPFLRGLAKSVVAKFDAIMKDKSIPREEKHAKIDELAEKELTGDNLKKFKEFKAKIEKQEKEFKEKEAKLSAGAKAAHEKIEALDKQRFEIMESLSEEEKNELFDLMRSRPGPHGPPPPPPPPQF